MKQAERRIKRRNEQVERFLRGSKDDDSDDDDDDDDDDDMDDKDISSSPKGPAVVTAADMASAEKPAVVASPTSDKAALAPQPLAATVDTAKTEQDTKEAE